MVHWGSTSNIKHDIGPRISLAFEFQRSDISPFNKPLLEPCRLPTFKERLNLIYVEHTGQKLEEVEKALDRDNFMTAEEAKAWGIIDKIITSRGES